MASKSKPVRKAAAKKTAPRTALSRAKAPGASIQVISPCLWFEDQAEEAAKFYVSVFKKAKLGAIHRYPAVGQEIHGREAGSVMTVDFTLNGLPFLALNGGPLFKFNEAVSLQVMCKTQEEVDYYWEKLGEGGDPEARQCGWLKDRFGLSWQVVPEGMEQMYKDHRSKATERVFEAMMQMKKLDIAALKAAYRGK